MSILMVVMMCVSLATASPALAARPFGSAGGAGRPIRLEGYWNRTRAEHDVIGEITITGKGEQPRRFGVTAVQAYHPEEEGMQIFRFTSDHPSTLIARGDGVPRLFAASPERKVIMFGTYIPGSGMFVVGSVDLAPDDSH